MTAFTDFTDTERAILRIVQSQLPDTLTPYADIAREVGTDEQTVLDLLRRLKESGAIRRFGASIKHQRTGWAYNAMVAWIVGEILSTPASQMMRRTQTPSRVMTTGTMTFPRPLREPPSISINT